MSSPPPLFPFAASTQPWPWSEEPSPKWCEALLSPSVTKRLIERFQTTGSINDAGLEMTTRLGSLTDREADVLAEIAQGLSNAEIAGKLFVSETTVKTHVGRVLAKLGVRDRVQAVVLAYESGLVKPGDSLS